MSVPAHIWNKATALANSRGITVFQALSVLGSRGGRKVKKSIKPVYDFFKSKEGLKYLAETTPGVDTDALMNLRKLGAEKKAGQLYTPHVRTFLARILKRQLAKKDYMDPRALRRYFNILNKKILLGKVKALQIPKGTNLFHTTDAKVRGELRPIAKYLKALPKKPQEMLDYQQLGNLKGIERLYFSMDQPYTAIAGKHIKIPSKSLSSGKVLLDSHDTPSRIGTLAHMIRKNRVSGLKDKALNIPLVYTGPNVKIAAEYAPGIPDKKRFDPIESIPKDKVLQYVLQKHLAEKAGKHDDLRFGDKSLYSWAVPKGLPAPGEKRLALRQPQHSPDYAGFTGDIKSGYGKGRVSTTDRGTVVVSKATPKQINFTIAHRKHPENFTLIKTKNDQWLLINTTPQKSRALEQHKKVKYTKVDPVDVEKVLDGSYAVSAKIDGAAALFEVMKNRIEAVSYRPTKEGKPIVHTKRIGGLENLDIPKEMVGKLFRGEIYGERGGEAIPPQELGGLLNSSLQNSLQKQKEQKVQLKAALFNILGDSRPYQEKLKEVQNAITALPTKKLSVPPLETDPDRAKRLFERIKSGKHPLTREGVVATPLAGGKPSKVKFRPEYDVMIRNIFPAVTKGEPRAGGFDYSLPGKKGIAGKVGTGFSHKTLKEMLKSPELYTGRTARILSEGQFPSGAYRAPSFISMHEDIKQESNMNKLAYYQGYMNKEASKNLALSLSEKGLIPKALNYILPKTQQFTKNKSVVLRALRDLHKKQLKYPPTRNFWKRTGSLWPEDLVEVGVLLGTGPIPGYPTLPTLMAYRELKIRTKKLAINNPTAYRRLLTAVRTLPH